MVGYEKFSPQICNQRSIVRARQCHYRWFEDATLVSPVLKVYVPIRLTWSILSAAMRAKGKTKRTTKVDSKADPFAGLTISP